MRKYDTLDEQPGNLLAAIPADRTREHVFPLADGNGARIERIVSFGQASPSGFWYDQALDEWVAVLEGTAGLRFEDELDVRVLRPGDYMKISAHRRHRVEWTDATRPTIWLAVHFS